MEINFDNNVWFENFVNYHPTYNLSLKSRKMGFFRYYIFIQDTIKYSSIILGSNGIYSVNIFSRTVQRRLSSATTFSETKVTPLPLDVCGHLTTIFELFEKSRTAAKTALVERSN